MNAVGMMASVRDVDDRANAKVTRNSLLDCQFKSHVSAEEE